MGRNEIRLRRSRLSGHGAERFRNYGAVLERHEKEMRLKKIMRAITYFLVILIVVALLVIVNQLEKKAGKNKSKPAPSGNTQLRPHVGKLSAHIYQR